MPLPKGFVHSRRTRMKIKLGRDPKQAPFSGKKHSKRTKLLLSMKMSGTNHPMFGKKVSEETRKKISASKIKKSNKRK